MVNVALLINHLGVTYDALLEAKLIPYKSKPRGDSGSQVVNLDMAREGLLLTFDRDSHKLVEITIRLIDEKNERYVFPNEIPSPLWEGMNQSRIREKLGEPVHFHPPHKIVNRFFGGVDYYELSKGSPSIAMLIRYDTQLKAISVTFKPASLVNWKPLPSSIVIK
ncbi:DUF6392 family protein [Aeromonas cavernicola]|uniref:Pyocin immunity protein n=1 Tax=Aeromonas cavernicola TaxID=1006623 RepID=A0A2H9U2M2_9GAMM|nr:DUF6392 family protein [Aeromonas cavernicola]PJG58219.1 pyocin immunity protein [Aeromonas cavernicola]